MSLLIEVWLNHKSCPKALVLEIRALEAQAAAGAKLAEAVLKCIASDGRHKWFCSEEHIETIYKLARAVLVQKGTKPALGLADHGPEGGGDG